MMDRGARMINITATLLGILTGIVIGLAIFLWVIRPRGTPPQNARDTLPFEGVYALSVPTTQGNIDRGFELANQVICLEQSGLFTVPGNLEDSYVVDLTSDPPACTCRAARFQPDLACKHVVAAAVHVTVPH